MYMKRTLYIYVLEEVKKGVGKFRKRNYVSSTNIYRCRERKCVFFMTTMYDTFSFLVGLGIYVFLLYFRDFFFEVCCSFFFHFNLHETETRVEKKKKVSKNIGRRFSRRKRNLALAVS